MIKLAFAVAAILPFPAQDPPTDERIAHLIEQLAADYEEERLAARKELEGIGEAAEPHLIAGLEGNHYRIRKSCLELLTVLRSPKAVDPAVGLLRSDKENKGVRQAAFEYLRTAGKAAEDVMIDALDSVEVQWRREALAHLIEIKSEKCAEKVAAMYDQETDKTIKDKAFECLQNIGKPAQPFLLKLLTSQDATVRHGAILGLKNIIRDDASATAPLLEPLSKLFLTETSAETLQEAADFLRTAGAKSEGTFLDGLKSPQEAVRLHSIRGLQDLRPAAALEPLSRLYEGDPSEPVRRKAGEVLEEYGAEAEPVFLRALSNTNAEVRMRAIAGLGNIKSEKPYETIAELFRTEKDPALHQRAFDYLAKVGRRAEKELLLALKDENQEIRREAIRALGLARSEAAIVPLIELLGDLNPEVVERSMDALVRIGPKATGAVEAAAAEGKVKKKSAEGILAKFHQEEIENILQKLVTEQGGTGFFEGQFADLEKFGKERALPILLRMGTDPGYQFRILDWKGGEKRNQMALRELAVMATGVLGYKEAVKSLKEALAGRVYTSGDEEYEIFVVTLYRLGEKGFYEALARKLAKDAETGLAAEDKTPVFNHLFSLALLQNRVGERREALATYEKLIELIEANKALWCRKCDRGLEKADVVEGNCKECGQAVQQRITTDLYSSALYNVACLCSLLDEKDKAVRALERAVDAGFDDRQWIEMDRDLEGIRGEEAYRKLMADAKRFEKPAPGSE